MTKIFSEITSESYFIKISGHVGFGDYGNDIVCAGVSALSICLVNSLHSLTGIPPQCFETKDGEITINIPKAYHSEKVKLLIDSFLLGITGISDSYPEFVKIIVGGS